jgi:hypothetical protein
MDGYELALLTDLVEAALAAYPADAASIRRGFDLVRQGFVDVEARTVTTYTAGTPTVRTVHGHCPCKSAQYGAPAGRCKHRWALALARRVQAENPWRQGHTVERRDAEAARGTLVALVCTPEWRMARDAKEAGR